MMKFSFKLSTTLRYSIEFCADCAVIWVERLIRQKACFVRKCIIEFAMHPQLY